jgi:AcrR family transcriptional regulator
MGVKERKEREKIQRKQLILEAAQKVFFTKGLMETTMDDIARESELAKGTLYLYFKSKEEIQFEVSLIGANLLTSRMKSVIQDKLSGLENLLRIGWEFIRFSVEEKDFFNLFLFFQNLDLSTLGLPQESVENYFLKYSPFKLIIDLVGRGMKDGSLRNDLDVTDVATTLWSNILGLLIVQKHKYEIYEIFRVDREKILQTNFEILMRGVSNPERS